MKVLTLSSFFPGAASGILEAAVATVAEQPRWRVSRLQPFAPVTISVTQEGYFINYSVDEEKESDGFLVRGTTMWITGDAWKSLLFGSRFTLPSSVENSGRRWLACDARFGRTKIGPEADPLDALRRVCTLDEPSALRVTIEANGYQLIGPTSSVRITNVFGVGLMVTSVAEHGRDLVAVELAGEWSLPEPSDEDSLDYAATFAHSPHKRAVRASRRVSIAVDRDVEHDFSWVVSSYDIIAAAGYTTAFEVEQQLAASGGLAHDLAEDVVLDSSGDQLIAFCRTRLSAEKLVAVLRALV